MPSAYAFNLIECGFWLLIAPILLVKSYFDAPKVRGVLRFLSLAFLCFAASDFIEARTGAWWKPLWLLVLKGGCIAAFLLGFRHYHRLKTQTGR